MKKFIVTTNFIFTGTFTVRANSAKEAEENVVKHCGLVIGQNIHSTLPAEDVDWSFNVHPDKEICKVEEA